MIVFWYNFCIHSNIERTYLPKIQKPFDKEKVRKKISSLQKYAYAAYKNLDDCGILYWKSFEVTVETLLEELGLK